jgi:hypothetical protein
VSLALAAAEDAALWWLASLGLSLAWTWVLVERPFRHASWQAGPAWPGRVCANWGHEIARFWDPRHLEEADPHGYATEYR